MPGTSAGYKWFTTDELIDANEHAEVLGHTRLLDRSIYDWLDPDGKHVVMREWPYAHHTGRRCEMLVKVTYQKDPVMVFLDVPREDFSR